MPPGWQKKTPAFAQVERLESKNGDSVIATNQPKAQGQKRTPNLRRLIGDLTIGAADAGYVAEVKLYKLPEQQAGVTSFEEWKRTKEGRTG